MITGFALAPASTEDQPLAETFFALRRHPHPRASSVGAPATGPYLTDEGFEGRGRHRRWARDYGAVAICPPPPRRRTGVPPWPRAWRRWLAGKRRVVETAIAPGWSTPSASGASGRTAWTACRRAWRPRWRCTTPACGSTGQLSRPPLAFADLVDW